jgi:hypothetical protein
MAKKTASSKPKKRVTAAFLREVETLAEKHGLEDVIVGQVKGTVPSAPTAADGCPPGKKLTRVSFKDRFGKTINTDLCL